MTMTQALKRNVRMVHAATPQTQEILPGLGSGHNPVSVSTEAMGPSSAPLWTLWCAGPIPTAPSSTVQPLACPQGPGEKCGQRHSSGKPAPGSLSTVNKPTRHLGILLKCRFSAGVGRGRGTEILHPDTSQVTTGAHRCCHIPARGAARWVARVRGFRGRFWSLIAWV